MPSLEQINKEVSYSTTTGIFTRLKTHRAVKAGDIAGTVSELSQHSKKYIKLSVLGKYYKAHRLAWFCMTGTWPSGDIDHINQNSLDNSWTNLRCVTHAVNGKNQKKYSNNSSGVTGVGQRPNGKWRARIYLRGKHTNLGHFSTYEDAVICRNLAAQEMGFHENHGK
jgi:hypothetical protein